MSPARPTAAGDAVAGLFARPSLTGGLARREPPAGDGSRTRSIAASRAEAGQSADVRVRLGVELSEDQIAWLRTQSRPAQTGAPRYLGAKFVATGLLAAAIDLARTAGIDMHGIDAAELDELTARCHDALVRAARRQADTSPTSADQSDPATKERTL
jgi:hypothetical protein